MRVYKLYLLTYLQAVLEDDMISDVPLLILANKIDKLGSAAEDGIRHVFALYNLATGKVTYL